MNALRAGAVAAVLVGAGVWCVALALRRAPRTIAAARSAMFGVDDRGGLRGAVGGVANDPRLVGWVQRTFGSGLRAAGLAPADVVSRVLVAAGSVALATAAGVVGLVAAGVVPRSPLVVLLVPAGSAMAAWMMVVDTRSRVAAATRDLRHATNEVVQLVAVGLTTDQSVEEALRFSLEVAGGPAVDVIRQTVSTAPLRGVPLWDALAELGDAYEVRELCEFASSIERQGVHGVSIATTVATLAASMRTRALDQLERDADKANANLAGPTIGFVVTTVVFLAYPLATRIGEAFGG